MKTEELLWIKGVQKEFKEKFGKRLEIDFGLMNGEIKSIMRNPSKPRSIFPEERVNIIINSLLEKHGTDIETVKRIQKIGPVKNKKESLFIREYSKIIRENEWNLEKCAQLINKDRSTLLYHSKNIKYSCLKYVNAPEKQIIHQDFVVSVDQRNQLENHHLIEQVNL